MYPNPQDALPLPERANREWYHKQAKDLTAACRSGDPVAIAQWVEGIAPATEWGPKGLTEFARERMARERGGRRCVLADAQFVIARAYGFPSWSAFVAHLDALEQDDSAAAVFERAADAVIRGDADLLRRLLREHPRLIHARSEREHRATLLHYVSANGVESYRQKTPTNAPEIAHLLLDAGAEVDAEADVYGGGATTLGLTATSVHPEKAGVQLELLDILLHHGARLEDPPVAGNDHGTVLGCLANGQPRAARYLAERGARLDLVGAAGIGRADVVRAILDDPRRTTEGTGEARVASALAYACGYGHPEVVTVMLDRGVAPDIRMKLYGQGHTGLHIAAYHAHVPIVRALLDRGADVHVTDATWRTTPLIWALQGWSDRKGGEDSYVVVETLIDAGAAVPADVLQDEHIRSDARMAALLPRS